MDNGGYEWSPCIVTRRTASTRLTLSMFWRKYAWAMMQRAMWPWIRLRRGMRMAEGPGTDMNFIRIGTSESFNTRKYTRSWFFLGKKPCCILMHEQYLASSSCFELTSNLWDSCHPHLVWNICLPHAHLSLSENTGEVARTTTIEAITTWWFAQHHDQRPKAQTASESSLTSE